MVILVCLQRFLSSADTDTDFVKSVLTCIYGGCGNDFKQVTGSCFDLVFGSK